MAASTYLKHLQKHKNVASNQLLWCSRLIFSDCWLDWPPHSPDLNPMEHLLFLWYWDLRFQSVALNFLSSVCVDKQILFWLSDGSLPHPTATLLQADLRLHRCKHSAGIKGLSGGTEEVWGRRRHAFYVVISLPSFTDASHRWIQSVGRGEQARSEVTARKSAARLICTSARTCIPQEPLWGKSLRQSKWSRCFRCFIPEELALQWQPGLPKPL